MTNTPRGSLRLQAVLANRRYSYGGQLPSEIENQGKTQNFGNMLGGGMEAMQRIFSNGDREIGRGGGNNGENPAMNLTAYSDRWSDGSSGGNTNRHQAIVTRRLGGLRPASSNYESTESTDAAYSSPSEESNPDSHGNSSNLDVADRLDYQPVNYKEMIPYLEKWDNRNFERNAAATGIAALTNAFGKTGGFSTVFGSYNPR